VSHSVTLLFKFLKYLKAKEEELWKFKIYSAMQKYYLQKSPLKETEIRQDIITL
jgi:hypothetical protein